MGGRWRKCDPHSVHFWASVGVGPFFATLRGVARQNSNIDFALPAPLDAVVDRGGNAFSSVCVLILGTRFCGNAGGHQLGRPPKNCRVTYIYI